MDERIIIMSEEIDAAAEQQFRELINSIKAGSPQEVQAILRNASSLLVNKLEPQFRQPPLYFAALSNGDELSSELIKLLLRYGANAKFKDHNEQTILFYICREGKEKCAEILLAHGLSLDEVDIYGQTPMFYAISENKLEIVRKYATKERLNHVDKLVGQTPLYYAARRGHLDMCKLLVQKGANVEHVDNTNKSAAEYAKRAKFLDTAEFLNGQIRRLKDGNKSSSFEEGRRKEDILKQPKQTYKIVFLNEKGEPHDLSEEEAAKLFESIPKLKELSTNPDIITEQQIKSVEVQTWDKIALKIVTSCSKQKGAFYFIQPVDPVKFNILDYFNIISKPMDLGTVKKRLLHNFYLSPEEFIKDMQLIWQNSYRYNGVEHMVSKCAKELEISFREHVNASGLCKYLQQQ